jgi:class 3 adenylate cyclase
MDLAGIAMHLAERVCSAAGPGQVLVTRTVVDLIAGSGITFDDQGEHELKGVPDKWRLFAVKS